MLGCEFIVLNDGHLAIQVERLPVLEDQLEQAKGIIDVLEGRQKELDQMLEGLAHEREHIDEVVQEMRRLRIQIQQKDALIAEMNEQLHSAIVNGDEEQGEMLFKQQQMQRDVHELRVAVQDRDQVITDLNAKLQQDGIKGDNVRGAAIAERERAISEQMQHLQEVAKHQYEMQAQLMEVQQTLQDQQVRAYRATCVKANMCTGFGGFVGAREKRRHEAKSCWHFPH